jgi:16S rRNA (guanine966-N2)-methyltransferase
MKIASGLFKSKPLMVPKSGVKPTSDKVRQAVMNILQNGSTGLRGSRFLDLYSGTGAVGLEALSNGASFVCFVENAPKLYMILKKNIESMVEDPSVYRTIKHNAVQLDESFLDRDSFDIIFADPFYAEAENHYDELYKRAMSFLRPGGIFILEHSSKKTFGDFPGFREQKTYGDTSLTLFTREAA